MYSHIAHRIANSPQKRITFAEYMDMALYDPEYGYYSTQAVNLGKQGDFFTSTHLGADFGEILAVQFVQMWEILRRPVQFSLVEMGAGQGYLASDILKFLQQKYPDFFITLEYIIVEKSPTLKQEQQQQLSEFSVRWCNLEEIPINSIVGCFFSNELVDALPVHQFTVEGGRLREIYVTTYEEVHKSKVESQTVKESTVNSQEVKQSKSNTPLPLQSDTSPTSPSPSFPHSHTPQFLEVVDAPSTPLLVQHLELLNIDVSNYPDNYRSEINLAARDWLSIVAEALQRGYVLTIDYGYSGNRYYNPRRSHGTLQCYYKHQRHNNPYIHIGQQDITTHVDFTALERWGEQCALDNLGLTQQGLFLMALGLGSRIAAISEQQQPLSVLLNRRDALHQLLDPMGLGGFCVLVQSKGLLDTEISQPLKGFVQPE